MTHTGLVDWFRETLLMHTMACAWNQQPSTERMADSMQHSSPGISLLPIPNQTHGFLPHISSTTPT